MRLLMVTEAYPPDSGGVATSAARIAEALAAESCEVVVVTYNRDPSADFATPHTVSRHGKVTLIRIGPLLPSPGKNTDPATLARQRAMLRRRFVDGTIEMLDDVGFEPDVVFSMYVLNAGLLATFVATRLDIPHVAGVRGNDVGRNLFDPALLAPSQFVLDRADAIVSVNEHLRRRMIVPFPMLEAKTTVIPNSLAEQVLPDRELRRIAVEKATGWSSDTLVSCFIGSLRESKGAFEIVSALTRLTEEGSRARLLVIGGSLGPIERAVVGEEFDQLVERKIIFVTGELNRMAVADWAMAADVLLMPSLDDGMANALLEGMHLGLCPVASGIFADVIVANRTGLLLDKVTGARIAEAIRTLEAAPDVVTRMGRAARDASFSWPPSTEARAYFNLFEKVAAARRRSSGADDLRSEQRMP